MTVPTHPTIELLREEFATSGLHGWLWMWLQKVLFTHLRLRIKPRYRASIYSPSGLWDEAGINDLINDFIVERGIMRGTLLSALQRAETTGGAVRYLERSFRNFAVSERRRTVASNIYSRVIEMLHNDPAFVLVAGVGARGIFGLAAWSSPESHQAMAEQDISDGVKWIPNDIKWVEYATKLRQSPGISTENLRRIAHSLILSTDRSWSSRQILRALELRFDLTQEGDPDRRDDLQTAEELPDPTTPPLEELAAKELAKEALAVLTPRQRRILPLMALDPPLGVREIGTRLGMAKSLVANEKLAIMDAFRRLQVSGPSEQSQLLDAASELLQV